MFHNFKETLQSRFGFAPNSNQLRDLERLIFEITRSRGLSLEQVLIYLEHHAPLSKFHGRNIFYALKQTLIEYRFPLSAAQGVIDPRKVFLNKLRRPLAKDCRAATPFVPQKIFLEDAVQDSELADNFRTSFPSAETEVIASYSHYLKRNPFEMKDLKAPLVFIVKERHDFLKPCPCTHNHLGCGYWIFNLGFGCPFDCSYCFLQRYANFPGIVLPANLDDFFAQFNRFSAKLTSPLRIGTGEFSDSLALDHVSGYSRKLISYFSDKKVIFELKTKSDNIDNLLSSEPSANIVVSWSLNPQSLIENEEIGVASLANRLEAARKVQKAGFKVGFHFDPLIHFPGWERAYKELVELLYEAVTPPFAWISLGSLRCQRELKTVAEMRFPESGIFYGELLIGEDKKLRYPLFLRQELYGAMFRWLRTHDQKTPIYLCMESAKMWDGFGKLRSSTEIEAYLCGRPRIAG